ncbi:bardet-biedl syndrome 1 protein [Reticulomyxa filosa]|uniref:Bardet-biedl syndrome 1 protein n=1 Tax=Reticulomyxa filosa TaxID=46433 RepID=X6NC44_RETFI|nr:bardet-biedl syndrome 1 protein [Reticulomyxa filosa]|eukprot:ETO23458.1 bardet-biedl syndrome 1 protein [Reticulomyxa filosa]
MGRFMLKCCHEKESLQLCISKKKKRINNLKNTDVTYVWKQPLLQSGPPDEQDKPLELPSISQLYIDQTKREIENAEGYIYLYLYIFFFFVLDINRKMHRTFQKSIVRFRLQTAQEYVKVLSKGQSPVTRIGEHNLALNIGVSGLGPNFALIIDIKNMGKEPLYTLHILASFDHLIYAIPKPVISVL